MTAGRNSELQAALAGVLFRVGMIAFIAWDHAGSDTSGYWLLAKNLVEHGTLSTDLAEPFLPSLYRPPVLPAFLALHQALFGENFVIPQLTLAVIATLRALLLARVAEALSPGLGAPVRWALVLSPFDAVFDVALLTESLCTTSLVAAFAAPLLLGRLGWSRWLLAGACFGLAALTRDVYLALPVGVALAVALFWREAWPRRLGAGVALLTGLVLVIAPWAARNHAHTGRWVPVTEGLLGRALWAGSWATGPVIMNDLSRYQFADDEEERAIRAALTAGDAKATDVTFRRAAIARYQRAPLSTLGRWLWRARLMWFGSRFDIFQFRPSFLAPRAPAWYLLKAGLYALNAALLAFAAIGVALALKQRAALAWLVLPVAYTWAIFLPLNGWEQRYAQPALPFATALAVFGAGSVWGTIRARARRQESAA